MGKGNKGGRNAYYYFMLEFKSQQGRNFKSMAEVATIAGPHWQRMTPQQRKKYEDIAKQNKENQTKQTSLNESVDLVLKDEQEKKEKEIAIKQHIDNIVKKAVNTKTIADQYFYLMHINEFCYSEREHRHYPAEVALGKFNLRNGIIKQDVYHSLIQPGPLPLGYSGIAKAKAEETHQLEHNGSENNMEEVLIGLIDKLTEDSDTNFPPIFVSEKDILLIENVLGHMCDDYGRENIFTLYSLQYLLFSIKNNVSPTGVKVWPTASVSKLQLEKDVYDYCSGITCEYHEHSEVPIYCSRSQIIRWAYIVCDNCIGGLDLPIIRGQHVPMNALTEKDLLEATARATTPSRRSNASYAPSVNQDESSSRYQTDDVSEFNTVVDETESSYHGFDSDSQVADDEEEWRRPRRPMRYKQQHLSQQSDTSSQLSQASTSTEYIPNRRPLSQSAVVGLARSNVLIGRGRGRGILQSKPSQ